MFIMYRTVRRVSYHLQIFIKLTEFLERLGAKDSLITLPSPIFIVRIVQMMHIKLYVSK